MRASTTTGRFVLATIAVLCALGPVSALSAQRVASRPPAHGKTEVPTRTIGITINGTALERDPAPRVVGGRVLVPVVRIYSALGIVATRDGDTIVATAPTKAIKIVVGSAQATIDGRPVTMEAPATEFGGTTYVPLRFVAESLGANVTYDAKSLQVSIASALVGRTRSTTESAGEGRTVITGTVSAIDKNSAPVSITVTRNGSVRTIAINSDARYVLQDVVSHTSTSGSIEDVDVGDALSVTMNKDGSIKQVVSFFASRSGSVAAVSSTAIVLNNGRVVTPDKTTVITLNGQVSKVGDLKPGDAVTVRLNPETGENRQIIASRSVAAGGASIGATAAPSPQAGSSPAGSPAPVVAASDVKISSLNVSATRPLRSGESFDVTLNGTPGGRATFDIGTYLTRLPMRESAPGTYVGHYTVENGVNFTLAPVFGHLTVGGGEAPRAEAEKQVSAATLPPTIGDVAPPAGQTVNNPRPSIYATFSSPTEVGINSSSAQITVNGHDVTSSSTRAATFITYSPAAKYADGPVSVTVKVADNAGNVATRTWTFNVREHP